MEPWQALVPIVGYTDEGNTKFTAEEIAIFAAAEKYDYMQKLMLLADRHTTSLAIFSEFCILRNEFRIIGPKPKSFHDEMGSTMLSLEEVNSFKPYTIPMNNLALGLKSSLAEDIGLARSVVVDFGPILKSYFKLEKFVSLTFPTDQELATMRLSDRKQAHEVLVDPHP